MANWIAIGNSLYEVSQVVLEKKTSQLLKLKGMRESAVLLKGKNKIFINGKRESCRVYSRKPMEW